MRFTITLFAVLGILTLLGVGQCEAAQNLQTIEAGQTARFHCEDFRRLADIGIRIDGRQRNMFVDGGEIKRYDRLRYEAAGRIAIMKTEGGQRTVTNRTGKRITYNVTFGCKS